MSRPVAHLANLDLNLLAASAARSRLRRQVASYLAGCGPTATRGGGRPEDAVARTQANYENISQVLAAMEVIAPDGTVTLYNK